MNTEPHEKDGIVTRSAKVFWLTREFWAMVSTIVLICIAIGFILGIWYTNGAYKEASDSRKQILAQCLTNNANLSSQLSMLGNKTADALGKASKEGNSGEQSN